MTHRSKNILGSTAFLVLNKAVCRLLTPNPAVLLTLLIDRHTHWEAKGALHEGDWFYKTKKEIEADIGLTRHEQSTALDYLVKLKLVETRESDTQDRKKFYRINWDNLSDFLDYALSVDGKKSNHSTIAGKWPLQEPESGSCNSRKPDTTKNGVKVGEEENSNSLINNIINNNINNLYYNKDKVNYSSYLDSNLDCSDFDVLPLENPNSNLDSQMSRRAPTFTELCQSLTKGRIPKQNELETFIAHCIDLGLEDELNSTTYIKILFPEGDARKKAMPLKKWSEWKESSKLAFEGVVARYKVGSLLDGEPTTVIKSPTLEVKDRPDFQPTKTQDTPYEVDADLFDELLS